MHENCNWKVSVESYSDCYRCTLKHRAFASDGITPQTYDIQPQGHCLRHTTECQNLDWPTFSSQVYPGKILNTYHWRPVSVDKLVVWRSWYTVDGKESQVIRGPTVQDR